MVDLPEGTIFRNALEARANDIALKFQADDRMGNLLSFDYTVPDQLTVGGLEVEDGRRFEMVVTLAKSDSTTVDRETDKAIAAFDRDA